jgi:predicted nucleic acid-binding Zn ribbon protein
LTLNGVTPDWPVEICTSAPCGIESTVNFSLVPRMIVAQPESKAEQERTRKSRRINEVYNTSHTGDQHRVDAGVSLSTSADHRSMSHALKKNVLHLGQLLLKQNQT